MGRVLDNYPDVYEKSTAWNIKHNAFGKPSSLTGMTCLLDRC